MNKVNVIKQNLEFIGKTWMKCIGTFASILSLFFLFWTWDDIRITSTQYKCVIIILLCVLALILAILWTCIFKRTKTIWESPSGKIKVCYSDIMKDGFDKRNKEEKLFVIPVNSCFDTIVDEDISTCSKPLVSPNLLHGRWIKTMVNKGFTIEEIDNKIHNCLEMQNLLPKSIIADEDKERGKREVYELGTVAMIRGNNNSTFLLLAISEYDKDNIAHTSVDDLEMCIKSLLNFYDQHDQGHRLVIPLMGTNLSRAGLSHNDSLRVITSLFQLYGDKIHGEVDVVIYKGDKDKVTLPVIVIYPDYDKKSDIVDSNGNFKKQIKDLWDKLPAFRDNMSSVATLHIPCTKSVIISALNNEDFMVNTMADAEKYYYKP